MRIKTNASNNEYIRAGDLWIRNYTKIGVPPQGLASLYSIEEHNIVLGNETRNKNYPRISDERLQFENIVIVSDGCHFRWKHLCIAKFPKNVAVLAINRALKNWKLSTPQLDQAVRKSINAYVINNPFTEAMSYLPTQYFPACIASSRTNYRFLRKYPGDKYIYEPTPQRDFGTVKKERYFIDDYRNPVCAAIGLAYRFGVKRLMLLSCDDSFTEQKDFAEQLSNGLWTYPQHLRAQEIIDANLYWLTHQEDYKVEVADWSDGLKYNNAVYISSEEEAIRFFIEEGTSHD